MLFQTIRILKLEMRLLTSESLVIESLDRDKSEFSSWQRWLQIDLEELVSEVP